VCLLPRRSVGPAINVDSSACYGGAAVGSGGVSAGSVRLILTAATGIGAGIGSLGAVPYPPPVRSCVTGVGLRLTENPRRDGRGLA